MVLPDQPRVLRRLAPEQLLDWETSGSVREDQVDPRAESLNREIEAVVAVIPVERRTAPPPADGLTRSALLTDTTQRVLVDDAARQSRGHGDMPPNVFDAASRRSIPNPPRRPRRRPETDGSSTPTTARPRQRRLYIPRDAQSMAPPSISQQQQQEAPFAQPEILTAEHTVEARHDRAPRGRTELKRPHPRSRD